MLIDWHFPTIFVDLHGQNECQITFLILLIALERRLKQLLCDFFVLCALNFCTPPPPPPD